MKKYERSPWRIHRQEEKGRRRGEEREGGKEGGCRERKGGRRKREKEDGKTSLLTCSTTPHTEDTKEGGGREEEEEEEEGGGWREYVPWPLMNPASSQINSPGTTTLICERGKGEEKKVVACCDEKEMKAGLKEEREGRRERPDGVKEGEEEGEGGRGRQSAIHSRDRPP